MWTLWTGLLLACCPQVWTMCNGTFSVHVPRAELLDDGRLLDVEQNVTYVEGDFWHNGTEYLTCPCNRQGCIFKCCPLDEEMDVAEEGSCVPARNKPFATNIQMLHQNPCAGSKLRLPLSEFTVREDGQLVIAKEYLMEAFTFCVDKQLDGDIVALVCEDNEYSRVTNGIPQLLAVPLLVVSLAIYVTTPRLGETEW